MVQASETRIIHSVKCWQCGKDFDLLDAALCGCGIRVNRPSKTCPHCLQCACLHPDYGNEALWSNAARFLKRHEFDKLFLLPCNNHQFVRIRSGSRQVCNVGAHTIGLLQRPVSGLTLVLPQITLLVSRRYLIYVNAITYPLYRLIFL